MGTRQGGAILRMFTWMLPSDLRAASCRLPSKYLQIKGCSYEGTSWLPCAALVSGT